MPCKSRDCIHFLCGDNLEKQHVFKKKAIKLKSNLVFFAELELEFDKLVIFAELELQKIKLENSALIWTR